MGEWRHTGCAALVLASSILAACQSSPPTAAATLPIQSPAAVPSLGSSAASLPTPLALGAGSQRSAPAVNCASPAALTPSMTEGPYFKAGSPERSALYTQGMAGTKLILTGYVLSTDCRPIAHALLDFWQADAKGNYDNSVYTLRGHQFADENGHYQLTTVVPGLYPGRTEHIHVKVQPPNGPVVTTQLFFPGVTQNQSDSIFDAKLLVKMQTTGDGISASYDFVINTK